MNKNLIRLLLSPFIILGAIVLLPFMITAPLVLFFNPLGWLTIFIGWVLWEKGFFKEFFKEESPKNSKRKSKSKE